MLHSKKQTVLELRRRLPKRQKLSCSCYDPTINVFSFPRPLCKTSHLLEHVACAPLPPPFLFAISVDVWLAHGVEGFWCGARPAKTAECPGAGGNVIQCILSFFVLLVDVRLGLDWLLLTLFECMAAKLAIPKGPCRYMVYT